MSKGYCYPQARWVEGRKITRYIADGSGVTIVLESGAVLVFGAKETKYEPVPYAIYIKSRNT